MRETIEIKMDRRLLASASHEDGTRYVNLYEILLPWDDMNFASHRFFLLSRRIMDYDAGCFDRFYNTFEDAHTALMDEYDAVYRRGDGKYRVYGDLETCEDWNEYLGEIEGYDGYHCNEEGRDYGPSNPWDAPGMKISDFICGVD